MCQNANFFGKAVVWFERFTPFSQRLYRICSIKKSRQLCRKQRKRRRSTFFVLSRSRFVSQLFGVLAFLFDVSAVLFNFCNQLNGNGFSVR